MASKPADIMNGDEVPRIWTEWLNATCRRKY